MHSSIFIDIAFWIILSYIIFRFIKEFVVIFIAIKRNKLSKLIDKKEKELISLQADEVVPPAILIIDNQCIDIDSIDKISLKESENLNDCQIIFKYKSGIIESMCLSKIKFKEKIETENCFINLRETTERRSSLYSNEKFYTCFNFNKLANYINENDGIIEVSKRKVFINLFENLVRFKSYRKRYTDDGMKTIGYHYENFFGSTYISNINFIDYVSSCTIRNIKQEKRKLELNSVYGVSVYPKLIDPEPKTYKIIYKD